MKGDPWQHLVDLTDFALALRDKLDAINIESFNNFELRVGKSNIKKHTTIRQLGKNLYVTNTDS